MDEVRLIEEFFAGRGIRRDDVRCGIGDDAAVTIGADGFELVIATDTICEGTHFPAGAPAAALGHRCLAVNLSDLAAMGAEPLWCTLSLTVPEANPEWLRSFADGFFALADRFGLALIGGDTVRGPLSLTVTIHGRVLSGTAIYRDGARDGDLIYVTGAPGQAAAGLRELDAGVALAETDSARVRRFWYPEPRVTEGQALCGLATAMIDVSDGLRVDVSRLLTASGLGAEMDLGELPLDAVGTSDALDLALNGGDDYELVFCISPDCKTDLERLTGDWSCLVTPIGTARRNADIVWCHDGQPCDTVAGQFEHFS